MLLDSVDPSVSFSFHVVETLRAVPPEKPFEVFDEGYLLSLRESRIALASPLGEEGLHEKIVASSCHVH